MLLLIELKKLIVLLKKSGYNFHTDTLKRSGADFEKRRQCVSISSNFENYKHHKENIKNKRFIFCFLPISLTQKSVSELFVNNSIFWRKKN